MLLLMNRNAREKKATPAGDTSGVRLWLVLWKAMRAVEAHALKSIASQPICGSDFAVLEMLLHKGPLPVNIIGRKVLLTPSFFEKEKKHIALLERNGWRPANRVA